jgi:hypothetical protein
MCVQATADRMWTLTFTQPDAALGTPERHRHCLPETHLYRYQDGTVKWRLVETCPHCCAYATAALTKLVKRTRRRWPTFQYLRITEVKPRSGAFDLNLAVTGIPPMTRKTRAGRLVKQMWLESGGGFMDLGEPRAHHSPGAAGRYIGKYLTKHSRRRMARGYRRWSRSRGFAPDVVMDPYVKPDSPKPPPIPWVGTDCIPGRRPRPWAFIGWVDPETKRTSRTRRDFWTLTTSEASPP